MLNKEVVDKVIELQLKLIQSVPGIRMVSSTLTRRMLPNRKLKISITNPPENPIITSPTAMPEESKTAMDASPEISYLSLIFVIISALAIDTPYAVHNG